MIIYSSKNDYGKKNIKPKLSDTIPTYIYNVNERLIKFKRKSIYFQTPIGLIQSLNKNHMNILFCKKGNNNNSFFNSINVIIESIHNELKSKSNDEENFMHRKPYRNIDDTRILFMLRIENKPIIFCADSEEIDIFSWKNINSLINTNCDLIIEISKIKLTSTTNSLNEDNKKKTNTEILCNICQIRKHNSYLEKNVFISNENNRNNIEDIKLVSESAFINHPVYSIYFKMINKKVPINAVRQKIIMDKQNPKILEFSEGDDVPSYLNSSNNVKKSINLEDITEKKNILKKTKINERKDSYYGGFSLGISLNDIKKALNSLRKT